ncbi:MAG: glutathione synthase [Betaproteobacteria bacterium]|nr:glutathione synthase [Betaproteobacteria bacterium]
MKFIFLIDQIDSLKVYKDSSIAMMREAAQRKHQVFVMHQSDLMWREGRVSAMATRLILTDNDESWYSIQDKIPQPLNEFDAVLVRKDPPFETEYLYATQLLDLAQRAGARVFNAPGALRDFNEKLAIARFPTLIAPTLVSCNAEVLRGFAQEMGDVILKPLDGMGGMQVFRVRPDGLNLNAILETLTQNETRTIMAQKYIPAINAGDKRIFMIDGEPVPYALARIPAEGETRANLAAGGQGVAQLLSARDREIAETVGPGLKAAGLLLVGLDVIGDYLTEINVTSPTGFVELSRETGINFTALFMDALENRIEQTCH